MSRRSRGKRRSRGLRRCLASIRLAAGHAAKPRPCEPAAKPRHVAAKPRAAKPRVRVSRPCEPPACRGLASPRQSRARQSRVSACRGEAALQPALRAGTASYDINIPHDKLYHCLSLCSFPTKQMNQSFDANFHKWSVGRRHEMIDFGDHEVKVQDHMRSKFKMIRGQSSRSYEVKGRFGGLAKPSFLTPLDGLAFLVCKITETRHFG